ncbi:hypothetical protein LLQ46_05010 [Rouxiella badensis]|uniref:hypothetical protein n=1 Tax=Rouxiella badensis TaxID=1646377 RepID=UPI001B75ADED|nr:hypothetical protein [Rouxiella badensis]MCC3746200.1 hypothetical protein [Rouxiella badensis]
MTNKTQIAELRFRILRACEHWISELKVDTKLLEKVLDQHDAADKAFNTQFERAEAAEARIAGIEKNLDAALHREKRVERQLLAKEAELAAMRGDAAPFMYAICHPDGSAWMDEGCVALDQNHLGVVLADLRRDTGEDYHIVPVFTHAQPVKMVVLPGISELIDACDSTPAVRDVHVWDLAISEVKRLNPSIFLNKSADGEGE